jgi:hypothetical protein
LLWEIAFELNMNIQGSVLHHSFTNEYIPSIKKYDGTCKIDNNTHILWNFKGPFSLNIPNIFQLDVLNIVYMVCFHYHAKNPMNNILNMSMDRLFCSRFFVKLVYAIYHYFFGLVCLAKNFFVRSVSFNWIDVHVLLVILVEIWIVQFLFDLLWELWFLGGKPMIYTWTTWSSVAEQEEQKIEDIVTMCLLHPIIYLSYSNTWSKGSHALNFLNKCNLGTYFVCSP